MKKILLNLALLLLLICVTRIDVNGQVAGFGKIKWEKEKISAGLTWKSGHTILFDSVPENINILVVNLKKREVFIQYDPTGNIRTSRQAASVNALAAVNAGFFNIKNGGSVTYIRTGGKIADSDTSVKWSRNANMTGSVLIRDGREVFIDKAMTNEWYDAHPEYDDVLVTGPMLVEDKKQASLPGTSLVKMRHPRTSIGLRNRRKLLLITTDGRTPESAGMTLRELADLMISLRCRDAVNLDGGGSTTMWINGKPDNGVVNMPCDNKKFDHYGERPVSDILIVK